MTTLLSPAPASRSAQSLDTPEPHYFSKTALLEGSWGGWLVAALGNGTTSSLRDGAVIHPAENEMFIVLSGCVVVTGIDTHHQSKPLFVMAMQRGDIIIRPQYSSIVFSYTAREDCLLLHLHGAGYRQFMRSVKNSAAGEMAAELTLLGLHGEAAQSLLLDAKQRLLRVAHCLASHPDVSRTRDGVMVKSTKEELLSYCGIFNRRIGAKAFKELHDCGAIVFEGYKRFVFRTTEVNV